MQPRQQPRPRRWNFEEEQLDGEEEQLDGEEGGDFEEELDGQEELLDGEEGGIFDRNFDGPLEEKGQRHAILSEDLQRIQAFVCAHPELLNEVCSGINLTRQFKEESSPLRLPRE